MLIRQFGAQLLRIIIDTIVFMLIMCKILEETQSSITISLYNARCGRRIRTSKVLKKLVVLME